MGETVLEQNKRSEAAGYLIAGIAQTLYGIFVFYWKAIKVVPAYETLAFRIFMSTVTCALALLITKKFGGVKPFFKDGRKLLTILGAGVLVSLNWGTYIWGVSNNFVVECSMGYFMMPIFTALCGVVFFKEKMDKYIIASLFFALAGVVYMSVSYGRIPIVGIILMATYSGYLTIKKKIGADPMVGVFMESLAASPLALGYFIYLWAAGKSVTVNSPPVIVFLVLLAGVITVVPLALSMVAQKKISMIAFGMITYLTPTLQMLIGVLVYKEEFTAFHAVALTSVIIALAIFTAGQIKKMKKNQEPASNVNEIKG